MKKIIPVMLACLLLLGGCAKSEPERFETTFYDTFDTVVSVIVYANNEEEGNQYLEEVHRRYQELDHLYDGFKHYDGIVNVKAVNDRAGEGKVVVDPELMELLDFSIKNYKTYGKTNIAFGAVTSIWQAYRDRYEVVPEGSVGSDDKALIEGAPGAELPSMDDLKAADEHTNIDDIVLYPDESAVEIKDPQLKIDVGAVAKGFATEKIGEELRKAGCPAALISAGGNVKIIGDAPEKDRKYFGVGIQNPEAVIGKTKGAENVKDVIYANDTCVVTSGDYQRFYIVDGKHYHHLIDPETLMPAEYARSVSIVTKDSGQADFLSTTVFCMPYEEGRRLVDSLDGVEAYWIFKDGTTQVTDGLKPMLRSEGATNDAE
ncbi:MAG: FAD:protein FMN transferase [Peptoniphilus sp.]|nr:FAD:protein FMN transferase [Peptoniphilus sp.]MDD7362696.1 FAD:protein FMN transferase [Bacillota bacterium]MDY6044905.1 FAD:protein FMN transferase [Peptoniphilus sp.]